MSDRTNLKRKRGDKLLALHHLPGQILTDEDLECPHWYEGFPKWPEQSDGGPRGTVQQWSEVAESALASASRMYEKRMSTSAGDAMKRAFAKEKTIGDKIAAVTLLVQESPVHRLDELRTLLSFAQKKGRRERAPAIEAVKDLFLNDLLPNNRRLTFFQNRHFLCAKGQLSKRHIIYAKYESELKSIYREFLQVLEESGKDTLAFFKQRAVKTIYELLVAKPENEKALLTMLVNKLGDPDRKVSSTASYSLLQLIEKYHPQMRLVVVKEVEHLLNRPHVTPRAQYYSVCFLNQIRFTDLDMELARKFVRIYMDLFRVCLEDERKDEQEQKDAKTKKKVKRTKKRKKVKNDDARRQSGSIEAKETKLMGALLVGVNRAFPYTKPEQDDSSYEDYYDSLFHVAHAKSLGPSTHALAFLFQVSQCNSTRNDRFYRALYSRIYDVTDCKEMTQAAFLNLVYKAVKADTNARRVKAFMKRLLQASCQGTPGFAGACMMVISEIVATGEKGILKSFVSLPEKDDQDEDFRDIEDKAQDVASDSNTTEISSEEETGNSPRNSTEQTKGIQMRQGSSIRLESPKRYDPSKRDPQHAGADRSSLWEAVTLTSHYHPSLSLFGKTLCGDMKAITYASDPLKDFSQIAFLDRFSYRKAKNRVAKSLYGKRSVRYRDGPLANSEEFHDLTKVGNIAEDDLFLARFFSTNPDRVQLGSIEEAARYRESHGSDIDSEEEAFERAMEVEMRRLGGGEGLIGTGIKDFGGDIDVANDDEIHAFEKAFANEMVLSEDEGDQEFMDMEPANINDKHSYDDDYHPEVSKVALKASMPLSGVFAAAEDYADAIDRDMDGRNESNNLTRAVGKKKKRKREGGLRKADLTYSVSTSAVEEETAEKEEDERLGVKDLPPPSIVNRSRKMRSNELGKKEKHVGQKGESAERRSRKKRKRNVSSNGVVSDFITDSKSK